MKRLAKIFLAFLGIFTLTSCMDLLPMPSRRTRSSSLSSEVMNEDYSTNERSSNSRTSRSSYTGEKNYYIETSDPAPNGFVYQTVSVYFYLTDDNGQHAELADNCFVESFSPDLTVAWAREYDYLEVLLNATNSGYYQFRVTVKATSGPSRTNNYYYNAVEGVDDISNYYVEHGDNIDAYYMSDTFLHFRILNKYNGNARRFDINHPYDVISLPSSAQIEYFDFVDNETTLRIVIKGFDYTPAEGHQFYLVLFDEAGNSFDTWLTYIIKPAAYLSIDGIDETPLIEHGETGRTCERKPLTCSPSANGKRRFAHRFTEKSPTLPAHC